MEALKQPDYYTIDDIYALPDGERAELIDGQIYYMAPPTRQQAYGLLQEIVSVSHSGSQEVLDSRSKEKPDYNLQF